MEAAGVAAAVFAASLGYFDEYEPAAKHALATFRLPETRFAATEPRYTR